MKSREIVSQKRKKESEFTKTLRMFDSFANGSLYSQICVIEKWICNDKIKDKIEKPVVRCELLMKITQIYNKNFGEKIQMVISVVCIKG